MTTAGRKSSSSGMRKYGIGRVWGSYTMKRLSYVTDEPWAVSTAPAIHVDRVCRGLAAPGWGVEVVQPGSAPRDDARPYVRVGLSLPGSGRPGGTGPTENLVTSL
jgi:hypothetical protein